MQPLWKTVWRGLKKKKKKKPHTHTKPKPKQTKNNKSLELPYDPETLLPCVYPKELKRIWKRYLHTHAHCNLTITKRWKSPKCLSTDEQIRKWEPHVSGGIVFSL